ncbi:MAG: carbohydrate kinase [Gammaproteobacteria bacterium]|nr:carbohydrate kinase [Gammaproteobacteria bacterium]MCK5092938.1 carbohydrate kinase [Gammaproteobacteria bacterium]
MPSQYSGRPIIYGEVLFDQFEDGTSVLGGAPFNVAWHLQGLGLNPLFISKIGKDSTGEQVLASMRGWGMDTRGIQVDDERPTGTVQVLLDKGQPTFDILPDQAYDHINYEPIKNLPDDNYSLLYHGSLITRSPESDYTLLNIITEKKLPVFVDINLRAPWSDIKKVIRSLETANWAKLNEHELASVLNRESVPDKEIETCASQLCQKLGLEILIVTLGEKGAYFISPDKTLTAKPVAAKELADTVGAGDAFSAISIFGLLQNWPNEKTLKHALEFSSTICGIHGATSDNHALYKPFRH